MGPPSGTLWSSARSILPSRGGWCGGRRGGRRIDLLLFPLPLAVPHGSRYSGRMRASALTKRNVTRLFVGADLRVGPCKSAEGHRTIRRGRHPRVASLAPAGQFTFCPHRPVAEASSTTGQRQRKAVQDVSLTSPGQRFPQGRRVSVPDCRAGPPTIPRRRQEVCAGADRPAEAFFLFGPCTARFSFGKTKREMGGASAQPSAWLNPPGG